QIPLGFSATECADGRAQGPTAMTRSQPSTPSPLDNRCQYDSATSPRSAMPFGKAGLRAAGVRSYDTGTSPRATGPELEGGGRMNQSNGSVAVSLLRTSIIGGSLLMAAACALAAGTASKPLYKDAKASVDERVEDLLSRMTLDEKIAQITAIWNRKGALLTPAGDFDPAKARSLYPVGIGHFVRPNDLHGAGAPSPDEMPFRDAKQEVALINAIQHFQMTDTRLQIPALFHEEGLHGFAARGATHFPEALALASTWDPELLTRIFTVVAREIRARGV